MTPPELTALGRVFKLNGYTMAGKPTVTSKGAGNQGALNLLESFPLSVLFDTAFTSLNSPQPVGSAGSTSPSQNGSFQFPEDASLFLAGAWSTHVGSFVQVTYNSQTDHFSWDNSDIRYANSMKFAQKNMTYGITLNNNPTVEDLWNSSPAWGYPWVGSNWAPKPTAGALINGGLAEDSAGIGAYAMWDNHIYVAASIYRSLHLGQALPNTGSGFNHNIRGTAPYWRVAVQHTRGNNYLEVGTYGIYVKSSPGAVTGLKDDYTDWGVDFQDDWSSPQRPGDVLSIRGAYVRENSTLNAAVSSSNGFASVASHHLDTVSANAEYHFGDRVSGTIGWFNVDGTPDPLFFNAGSSTVSPVSGSANGDPRNSGYIANLSWWPVQNISLTAQYTGYMRFNGGATNYDASGRNAGQNGTLYLLARFVF